MPSWPDILSKYNVLLSQTLNLSVGLVGTTSGSGSAGIGGGSGGNQFTRIALHPSTSLTDAALDNDLIPLLRNQQTTEVLRLENDTVRRLGEKMQTRGVAGVLGLDKETEKESERPTYTQVLDELTVIRDAHDSRVDRAIKAVIMLRDDEAKNWKMRVAVEVEEPEELEWDPRRGVSSLEGDGDADMEGDGDGSEEGDAGQSSDEEDAVDAMVVGEEGGTPGSVPGSVGIRTPGGT